MDSRDFTSIYSWFLLLFFLTTFGACIEESKDLTREERVVVDTLVIRKTNQLRVEIDSICDEQFNQRVNRAMDSILQVRIKEIEAILNRK